MLRFLAILNANGLDPNPNLLRSEQFVSESHYNELNSPTLAKRNPSAFFLYHYRVAFKTVNDEKTTREEVT